MKNLSFIIPLLIFSVTLRAQSLAVNGTGASADASAILDVQSTTKGLLAPKMTAAQRTAISSPATGLVVFQTDGSSGFYYNAGTSGSPSWIQLIPANGNGSGLTNLNAGNITSGTVAAANGGTGQTSYTTGDILYASGAAALSKLNAGSSGTVLTSNGAGVAPSWQSVGGGSNFNVLTKSANYTIQASDLTNDLIVFNTSSASQTDYTLPLASSVPGKKIYLVGAEISKQLNVKTTSPDKIFGIATGASGLTDFAASVNALSGIHVISNGTNWYLVAVL